MSPFVKLIRTHAERASTLRHSRRARYGQDCHCALGRARVARRSSEWGGIPISLLTLTCFREQDMDPFTFVEINGMKIADPSAAFSLLWETLSGTGDKLPPKQALAALEAHFREPTPGRKTT